jgi:uncharacterized protein YndB with AHSA1/START domain
MIADIVHGIDIAAPVERVWQVLTGEGLVEQWLGCLGYRAEPGHVFYMQPDAEKRARGDLAGATHCELLRLDPPRLMAFSWYYPDTPRTEVEIRLARAGAGTRVELVHRGWDRFDEAEIRGIRDMLDGGWRSFVLPGLKALAEKGERSSAT